MITIQNSYRFGVGGGGLLTEATYILALENHYGNWTKAVIQLQRVSDDDLKYVFFDGDEITLNSFVSDDTDTPSATTLGTWIGSGDAHGRTWYRMNSTNTVDTFSRQNVKALQPQFITSGVIFTKNGKAAFNLTSSNLWFGGDAIIELDEGNDFSILTISSNNVDEGSGAVFSTVNTADNRLTLFNDSRTIMALAVLKASGTSYRATLLLQQNTTDQKLLSTIVTSTDLTSFFNGAEQVSVSWSGTYVNDMFRIGNQINSASPLNGSVQFIAIYDTDRDSDISNIQTEINNYYSIY